MLQSLQQEKEGPRAGIKTSMSSCIRVGETRNEAAEVLTSYDVNLFVLVSLCERLDAAPEGCRVKAQCGDVPEQNSLLWEIWDTPYGICHKLLFLLEQHPPRRLQLGHD